MPRMYCFVGPSLPEAAELTAGSGIRILPPVAAGDLVRVDARAGDTIGIIDGYFHQTGAVRHKEILDLLSRGVRVLGAASMGALRAAELDRYGMQGIGGVYADYRDGRLEADDEVTLLHAPGEEGYQALSEPLVCMRATFAKAVGDNACDASTADRLIDVLAQRSFGLRTYSSLTLIGAEAGLDAAEVRSLQRYCRAHRQDPKREDALLLLEQMRAPRGKDSSIQPKHPAVHRTTFLYAWQLAARGVGLGQDTSRGSELSLLRACQLFSAGYAAHHRRITLRVLSTLCTRECAEHEPGGTDADQALRHGEHRGLYRLPPDRQRLGFLDQWLTPAEMTLPLSEQLTTFLVRACRTMLRLPWDELALELLADPAVRTAAEQFVRLAWQVNDRSFESRPDLSVDGISKEKVVDLLAECWNIPTGTVEFAAMDRGFASADHAVTAARPFYLFARYNKAAARLNAEVGGITEKLLLRTLSGSPPSASESQASPRSGGTSAP